MIRLELIKRIDWFHFFFLKVLLSEPDVLLSAPEIGRRMGSLFESYGVSYLSSSRRVKISQKAQDLVSLGVVLKTRGDSAYYRLNPEYKSAVLLLVSGFMDILVEKKGGV